MFGVALHVCLQVFSAQARWEILSCDELDSNEFHEMLAHADRKQLRGDTVELTTSEVVVMHDDDEQWRMKKNETSTFHDSKLSKTKQ